MTAAIPVNNEAPHYHIDPYTRFPPPKSQCSISRKIKMPTKEHVEL